jgi:hypothetical protein
MYSINDLPERSPSYTYKRAAPDLPTPMSREVCEHLLDQHEHECPDYRVDELPCDCGRSVLLVCATCGARLVLFAAPEGPCMHALRLLGRAR